MANAGCINAISCDGCLIQTLGTLDSACIGVGVQFCVPNPLDDKRLNYIKYTDKCGCTCCLSGENEIKIYATNGVVKNFTLTNDEDNEAVNVKRSDVFGSNRAKTVVRYSTTAYPTSPTDGTLAVEETTKNQYESSGFDVSGLDDGILYYFTAFALDSNDNVIDSKTGTITTSFGRQPTANTIVYIPMRTDLLDHGPNNFTITNNNSVSLVSNVGTASIPVGNFGDGTARRYLTFTSNYLMNGTSTVSVRVYYNGYTISGGQAITFAQGTNTNYKCYFTGLQNNDNHGITSSIYGTDIYSNVYPIKQNRHHVCRVYEGNKAVKQYLDGQLIKSGSFSTTPSLTLYNAHIGTNPRNTSAMFNGYMSDFICEKVARTQAQVQEYVQKTRKRYGILNDYQEVEYIKSSGNCYIDTGYLYNDSYLKIEAKILFDSFSSSDDTPFVYGVIGRTYGNYYFAKRASTQSTAPNKFEFGAGTSYNTDTTVATGTIYESMLEYTNGTMNMQINSSTYTSSATGVMYTGHSLPLFCRRDYNSGYNYYAQAMRLYSCKLYSASDTVERDFVPCYRKGDNVIGLFDKQNGIFYKNAGTGSFTKGADV